MSEPAVKEIAPVSAVTDSFTGPYDQTSVVLDELIAWLLQTGHPYSGSPFAIYYDDPAEVEEDKLRAEVCLPVAEEVEVNNDNFQRKDIEGGRFVALLHQGPYAEIPQVYENLFEWVRDNGFEYIEEMGTREVFRKIMGEVDSAEELQTEIMIPVRKKS